MSDFKRLRVWRKAHSLALNAHQAAMRMRGGHYAPFRSQIVRSALSVPANIVEGREQDAEAGFARFLKIALGSVSELENHLLAARDIGALSVSEYQRLASQVAEVRMMLHGLLRRLKKSARPPEVPPRSVPAS